MAKTVKVKANNQQRSITKRREVNEFIEKRKTKDKKR